MGMSGWIKKLKNPNEKGYLYKHKHMFNIHITKEATQLAIDG